MAAAVVMKPSSGEGQLSQAAASVLALLQEDDRRLQEHALRKLNALIDTHWADVAQLVVDIEALADDESFPARELAASVSSKCYYHLEEYGEALRLALGAGSYFDVNAKSEYTETIIARCIDEYTRLRVSARGGASGPAVDPRLESVVSRMFSRCWAEGAFKQALGVALEARRLDVVEETIRRAYAAGVTVGGAVSSSGGGDGGVASGAGAAATRAGANAPHAQDFFSYAYDVTSSLVASRDFRREVFRVLVKLHHEQPDQVGSAGAGSRDGRNYLALCRCLHSLDDAPAIADILHTLLKRGSGLEPCPVDGTVSSPAAAANSEAVLLAYQIAFDLVDSENQDLLVRVYKALPAPTQPAAAPAVEGAPAAEAASTAASADPSAAPADAAAPGATAESTFATVLIRLRSILDGSFTAALMLDFLSRNDKADPLLLKQMKTVADGRNSVLHNAAVVSHAYMHAGTTVDTFMRSNLEWMGKAANWARFTAVASQGVVHKGHLDNAMTVLSSFLPKPGEPSSSVHSEGGALFALGLIHANRGTAASAGMLGTPGVVAAAGGAGAGDAGAGGEGVIAYLSNALKTSRDEVVLHGACLGLGSAAMGTGTDALYSDMREVLVQDSAVSGEAAGLGIGLILLGRGAAWTSDITGESAASEMLGHAHDTKHEKTIRGIAMGVALMAYGLEESADMLIDDLKRDKDAVLRYGAMFATGMAYSGTANNKALRSLLHVAVTDVSDDVRRAAVMNVGFLLNRQPNEVPVVIGQLADSYNPHVRYGAAMALGIACAGTGLPEAIAILEPMLDDTTDFVRQGAYIALGLVLQQESEAHLPRAKVLRDRMLATISNKHESTMTKMGALLALGIIDAGGRNCVATMLSRGGFQKTASVVGLALFLQYWYWFPLLHFLSLAVTPTVLIGLQGDMKVPTSYTVACACPPSWFAYPPAMEEKKDNKKEAVTTVELSTAAKARAKAKAKAKAKDEAGGATDSKGGDAADTDAGASAPASSPTPDAGKEDGASAAAAAAPAPGATPGKEGAAKEKEKEKEPSHYTATNPCRVTPAQAKFIHFASASTSRYLPLRKDASRHTGVLMLRDTAWGTPDSSLKEIQAPEGGKDETDEGPEPGPPAAFEWVVGQYY